MLALLTIQNLGLIQKTQLEFDHGLNVLTGETGAGKSMIIDALSLLMGERAAPSLVREGTDRAQIEAVFDIAELPPAREWLDRQGLLSVEPHEVVVRREVLLKGRSRSWINGRLVPVGQLAELGAHLAEMHGQHQSLRLLRPAAQRATFDHLAATTQLANELNACYGQARDLQHQLDALHASEREERQRLDFLRFQIEEIDALALEAGEDELLQRERQRLAHGESLRHGAAAVLAALMESTDERPTAIDLVGEAEHALAGMARHDSALDEALARLSSLSEQLGDVAREICDYADSLDADPDRLAEIEERLEAIRRLERKHGPGIQSILAARDTMLTEAATLENRATDTARLEQQIAQKRAELGALAARLTKARSKARKPFEERIAKTLQDLAMNGARIEVHFAPIENGIPVSSVNSAQIGSWGAESIEFLFSANIGEPPRPMGEVASGGELSRLMLALHGLASGHSEPGIVIFDEIDAGLGGQAARHVARALEQLATRHQVLCVTHQPTIASRAATHWLVEKQTRSGRTTATAHHMQAGARKQEIARLLDGAASERSLALADELLAQPA